MKYLQVQYRCDICKKCNGRSCTIDKRYPKSLLLAGRTRCPEFVMDKEKLQKRYELIEQLRYDYVNH